MASIESMVDCRMLRPVAKREVEPRLSWQEVSVLFGFSESGIDRDI